jgi:hypothetical protein
MIMYISLPQDNREELFAKIVELKDQILGSDVE